MKDAHSRTSESRRLDGTAPPDQKRPSYQELLDESLDQTFPASDPISPSAAMYADRQIESARDERDWSLAPGPKTPQKAASPTPTVKPAPADAITLLKADHAEVAACFRAYQKLVDAGAGGAERQPLAEQICLLLTVHAAIEEEIFYPAARKLLGADTGLIDEADIEHASAKDLIAQIRAMGPDEDLYDAKLKVLGEYIDHHVTQEQDEMFPKLAKAGMDTKAIGAELGARKQALIAEVTEGSEA